MASYLIRNRPDLTLRIEKGKAGRFRWAVYETDTDKFLCNGVPSGHEKAHEAIMAARELFPAPKESFWSKLFR